MIHGLPGTHKDYDPVIPEPQGMHVISIDRPGFGWSKGGWLSQQDQIDVVHEMLTKLKLAPAILVGHSFGGTLTLGIARRHPQDIAKVILVGPSAGGLRPKTWICCRPATSGSVSCRWWAPSSTSPPVM